MSGQFGLPMIALIFAVYTVSSAAGLALVKAADGYFTMRFLLGGVLYAGGFAIWILLIIRMMPLSVAFPVSAGLLILATQVLGAVYLGESVSVLKMAGAVFVIAGIAALSLSADQ
ncbi:MAG: hypothetical protein HKN14_11285 [Marinicaulis sp.]|nr:hypothetical protein [Marinicaulis sp.]NNE41486.1 hypothetical protein [Marinicaulis sp.]